GGKVVLSSDKIVTIRRRATEQNQQEKEAREEYPRLIVDCETKAAYLNDYPLDLHPSDEEIEKDIKIFVRYMQGFEKFPGDTVQKQRRYFEFAAWFFATPFLAVLRNTAAKNGKNHLSYPIFGLLCGSSKAGKTTFLETLLKMMIGQKIKISAPKFTRTGIDSLRKLVKGAPIIVDDLTSKRFNDHATETIKYDDFGLLDNDILYPAVVISANEDVKVASHELVRRTVVCHVQGGLKTIDSMKSNIVSRTQNHMGTALYREYLRIMLRKMPDALDWLKSQDENAIPPDIFMLSSATLCSIFLKHNGELPHYVRKLTSRDYFDEKVTGANAIKKIRTAWIADRESFVIDKRRNELRYNVGQTYEAERLRKELPEDLEASRAKDWVIMRLDTSKKFFGLDFRRGFFR
ncbi:MAG: hypothetical protein FWD01_05445, partial [Defluviitaleaceae bacterium]|nr:hypothetical protein [Defluviitaleaceae bacterium]